MLSIQGICLMAAIVTSAQDAPAMPEAWKQKIEAAAKAMESGHPIQAEALLAEIVEEAERLGKDDLRLAKPLEQLALFYLDEKRKRYTEAEPLFRRVLAIREKAQGPNHPDVAWTLTYLSTCRMMANEKQVDAAGPMMRRAMSIIEKSRPKDDPDVARMLHSMAVWHLMRKEFDAAEVALTRAVAIREKTFGPGDPDLASPLDDLGDIHAAQSDGIDTEAMDAEIKGEPKRETKRERHAKQAESYYAPALAIREKTLKPDDPKIADSLYNLGQLATSRERFADVERYLDRWLVLEEKARTPAPERQAKALVMLATASMASKDFDQMERRLARAQAVLETVKGADSEEASMILGMRADNALRAGRLDDAERFLKRGLEVQAAYLGPDDAEVKEARALMAGRYQDHVDDRRAPLLWHRLDALGKEAERHHNHTVLGDILQGYAGLLRRTNRALPRPTEEDLAYLKKVGAVISLADLDYLAKITDVDVKNLGDEGLAHIARLYDIDWLSLGRDPTADRPITDAGLAHLKGLINLKVLLLLGARIGDAGLAHIGRLESLEQLHLGFTRVGDAGMAHLRRLKKLRDLSLTYTDVTDAGLDHLKGLEHLKKIDLVSTKVTAAGIHRLRQARPGLVIEYEPRPAGSPDYPPVPALVPTVPAIAPELPAPR